MWLVSLTMKYLFAYIRSNHFSSLCVFFQLHVPVGPVSKEQSAGKEQIHARYARILAEA